MRCVSVQKLFSSMRPGSGQNRENKATADSLRMDYHMRGNNNGSRKPIQVGLPSIKL